MMPNLKHKISGSLLSAGVDVRRASNTPFGVRWWTDLKFFDNGKSLQVAIDAGANLGQTASQLAVEFPHCRVYSFEPVAATFEALKRNVASFPNVIPFCSALGSAPGEAKMRISAASESNSIVAGADDASGDFQCVTINTVDAFCAQNGITRVNLLKIDTEGHEMQVLKGAAQLLANNAVDFILCECEFCPRPGQPHGNFAEILACLTPLNFRIVSFYTGGVDDMGWIWGDVLLRHCSASAPGRVACAPLGPVRHMK